MATGLIVTNIHLNVVECEFCAMNALMERGLKEKKEKFSLVFNEEKWCLHFV